MRAELPIYEIESELVDALRETRRVVLSAPTGSGKSTQVPRILRRHGFLASGAALMLQPRRLAARMLAKRIAEEESVALGREVGYQVRFENRTCGETEIALITEGILLRRLADDSELRGVSALIFDEFHERNLYGDVGLAKAVELQETLRPDLLIVVMSATLETATLREYLDPCVFLESEGRTYPVAIEFAEEDQRLDRRPIWDQAADAFVEAAGVGLDGDALVFMPGAFEIRRTVEAIRARPEASGRLVVPLHGELPPAEQDAAVGRSDRPKVVVATNVAETSLTIDGITLVIDSGLARIPRFDPYRGLNTLLIQPISRASADQRAGRAGRTAPGLCLRLWSEAEHRDRLDAEAPEVKRLDLSETLLSLKALGVGDLSAFRWLDAPEPKRVANAVELLQDLGALDREEAITEMGREMLAFPAHPRYARLLIEAGRRGCVEEAALVAAFTQGKDLFVRKVEPYVRDRREDLFGSKADSDFFRLAAAFRFALENKFKIDALKPVGIHAQNARQAAPVFQQFMRIAERRGLSMERAADPETALRRSLLVAFSDRLARPLDSGTLQLEIAHGKSGTLARESVVRDAPLLVVAESRELEARNAEVMTLCSHATRVEPEWVREIYGDEISREVEVFWDGGLKRVCAHERERFRGVTLTEKRFVDAPKDRAASILAEEVLAGRLKMKTWDHSVDQWVTRVNFVATHCPEFEIPAIGPEEIRAMLEALFYGAVSFKEIKERPVRKVFRDWLNATQRSLVDQYAPERIQLANGKKPKVAYHEDGRCSISLRIQELYDTRATPLLAMDRVKVVAHVLAPNNRPIQMTSDLENFWKESYPGIRSQLRGRYPKHEWREEP